MQAIILAGGFGTRLRVRVSEVPKPMAPIAGKPFLQFLLDQLVRDGFTRVILSVGYLHEVIQQFFGTSYRGMMIEYAVEAEPLGTGGALQYSFEGLVNQRQPVLVLNGDTYLDLNYRELMDWFECVAPDVVMVLRQVADVSRYGRVELNGLRVAGFQEKGQPRAGLINAGTYVLRPETLMQVRIDRPFSLERDFFGARLAELNIVGYVKDSYFIDIGVPEDFDRAQTELPLRSGNG